MRKTTKKMVTSGSLGDLEDIDVEISAVEDVQPSRFGESTDPVLLSHIISLRNDVLDLRLKTDERLRSIELHLRKIEAWPIDREGANAVEANDGQGKIMERDEESEHLYGNEEGTAHPDVETPTSLGCGSPESDYERPESDYEKPESDYDGE